MKAIINEQVYHNKYGYGTIVAEETPRIKIKFDATNEVKSFTYPNVFEKHLKLTDTDLQNEMFDLAVNQRKLEEKEQEERRVQILQKDQEERKTRIIEKKKKASKKKSVKKVKEEKVKEEKMNE